MLGAQSESRGRGIGRYCRGFVSALLRRDPGNEFFLYAHAGLPVDDFPSDASCAIRPLAADASPAQAVDFLARTNPDQLDVLLILSPLELHRDYAPPAKPLSGLKLAALIYDLIPFRRQEQYLRVGALAKRFYRNLERLRAYDRLLAISEATRDDCRSLLGLVAERVVNVGAACDPSIFWPANDRVTATEANETVHGLGIKSPFVFCLGSSDERKNLKGLVDAFALLPGELKENHQLVIACDLSADEQSRIRAGAHERGIEPQLVLTGAIDDSVLRALYQTSAMFAFPSLYEGFGLPLLEAMHCGAVVVAGNNSAQTEVVGDAGLLVNAADAGDIAAGIRLLLTEPQLACELRVKSLQRARRFQWRHVAQVAANALAFDQPNRVPERKKRLRVDQAHAPRPRIALFSPFPPKPSGISDYAARLAPHLARYYTVDLYHEAGYVPDLGMSSSGVACHDYRLFPRNATQLDYRGVLYQMGNSHHHRFIYETLQRYPGVVTLHDFCLAGFHDWYSRQLFAPRDYFQRELLHSHAALAGGVQTELPAWSLQPDGVQTECARRGLFLNRRVFENALRVVVHSQWCLDQTDASIPEHAAKTIQIPFGAEAVELSQADRNLIRERYKLPQSALIVASVGVLHPSKLNVEAVEAFAAVSRIDASALFVFVGPDFGCGETWKAVRSHGLESRVRFFGQQSADVLAEIAAAADIGVNLRRPPTNGETSAALLDLLRVGVPTIVTDVGTFSEYPDHVVLKVHWETEGVEGLVRALSELAQNSGKRRALGRAALDYVRDEHTWPRAAAMYRDVLEACRTRQAARLHVGRGYDDIDPCVGPRSARA
jgi:glycosyltransferase involved in cell wall biosynthesis